MRLWKAALACLLAVSTFGADANDHTAEIKNLRSDVLAAFEKSVAACTVHQHGNPNCVKKQFEETYKWYVLGEKNWEIGPPGTPGPVNR